MRMLTEEKKEKRARERKKEIYGRNATRTEGRRTIECIVVIIVRTTGR